MSEQTDLGKKIAMRLVELDMHQYDLARKVGISHPAISHIISGKTKKTAFINEIADALRLPVDYLLGKESPPWDDSPDDLDPTEYTTQAARDIKDKVNDVIIALAADRDINTAIRLCAEIMNDLEVEYL